MSERGFASRRLHFVGIGVGMSGLALVAHEMGLRSQGLTKRHPPTGDWIVLEADESDRSLLNLRPEIALATSAEVDHHTAYASRLGLEATLRQFMAHATRAAVVWNRPELRALCPPGAIPYDAPEPLLEHGRSRLAWRGLEVSLRIPGARNAINAAGALEVAALAGADAVTAARSLHSFAGVHRRLELLGHTQEGASVYDDYAHNPTKIAAAIDAGRTFGPRRVMAVFRPHQYSRTAVLWRQLGAALAGADAAVVLDVYPPRASARKTTAAWAESWWLPPRPRRHQGVKSLGCPASRMRARFWLRPCGPEISA